MWRHGFFNHSGIQKVSGRDLSNGLITKTLALASFELLHHLNRITVDSKMVPGQYLLKLRSQKRASTFVPLVVTGSGANDLTFVSSVLTWQSYNQWGGESLYKGADGNRETAASVVSFDRPYDGDGSGQFRYMEQPLVTLMEKAGLDINYITDLEVDSNPEVFAQTRSIRFRWTQRILDQSRYAPTL